MFLLFCLGGNAWGQVQDSTQIIQFSGVVTTEIQGEIVPLPYATVGVLGTNRGAIAAIDGFFSLVVLAGDEIEVRSLGFESERFVIPDTTTYFSIVTTLRPVATELPMAEILPIPSREFFKEDFLAMEAEDPLMELARKNLDSGLLAEISESLPADGTETGRMVLRERAASYYSNGQFRPQNIFNPMAWKRFIEAWRRGDYKKKKKK